MPRHDSGELRIYENRDGTRTFSARIRVDGNRYHVPLGHEREGMTLLDAERELADILARARVGRFVPPQASRKGKGTEPDLFVNAASRFLKAKRREGLKPTSLDSLSWALDTHLLPFFGRDRVRTIDVERVEAYVEHEARRRDEIALLSEHGSYLEGPSGGAMRPMANRSINTTLEILTQLLDWTAARGLGPEGRNPAAGLRLRASGRTNLRT